MKNVKKYFVNWGRLISNQFFRPLMAHSLDRNKAIFYFRLSTSVTSNKLPKNEFTTKMKDFDTFTKIAKECGRFGQTNFSQRL